MAAIAGVLRLDGAPEALRNVRTVMARMSHRAPDGVGEFGMDGFALAHGALHTTPEAVHERQPILLGERWVLAVDGRIDNRDDLIRALGLDPSAAGRTGDADLFAQAWLRWGEDFWKHVVGDFALAAWDRQERRLSLLRDRIGVRPLYWARTSAMLAFASEAEALLGVDGIPAEPNPERVASSLVPEFDDEDRSATLYRDIQRLLPGEVLEVAADGRVALRRHWAFGPLAPLRLPSRDAYVEAFRAVFDDAVRVRLQSPTTPALMLSGGIDSAAVHASALGQGLPLRRVSVVADQPWAEEERSNIETLLAQAPGALRLPIPGLEGVVDLPRLLREVFEHAHPIRNSIILPMLVNQAAAAAGSRVMLDGIDGDLAMSTPDNYIGRMALAGQPLAAWREARAAAKTHTYLKHLSAPRIVGWGVASRLEPRWLAGMRYRLADARAGDAPYRGLLHPDKLASLRLRERMLARRLRLRADPALRDWTGYRHWVWTHPGLMRGMEGFDLAAARFGVEARHPWCDQRVIDFFLRVPMEVVVRDGWTKHVARAAYAPVLGAVGWHSGKQHLGPQVTRAVLEAGRDWVTAAMADAAGVLADWIDPAALAAARAGWAKGTADPVGNDAALEMATLQRWLASLGGAGQATPDRR